MREAAVANVCAISSPHYRVLVVEPPNKVIFEFLIDRGLVELNGKTPVKRAQFCLLETPNRLTET